jgi:hypothetical protein
LSAQREIVCTKDSIVEPEFISRLLRNEIIRLEAGFARRFKLDFPELLVTPVALTGSARL